MNVLPQRLNTRIILFVSCIMLVTALITGWASARNQTARLLADMRRHSSIMAKNLAESSARYLLVQDYAELETLLLKAAEGPDIQRLQVCEPDGLLLWDVTHHTDGPPISTSGIAHLTPPISGSVTIAIENDILTIWQPIAAGNLLGWLKADYSLASIRTAQARAWKTTILLTIVRVCSSAFLIVLLLRPIANSISRLTAFATHLDEHKGAQYDFNGQPIEIAELGAALNETSQKLQSTEQQLLNDQDRLRRSEENYRRLLDTVQEGIWVIDSNSITTF
ncbi:MAG: hypothetical protein PHI31_18790, partial [Desulfuromonadaceae bacterium]|nr:hypothetical protein [Desulfuromonadaceae bacterium]